MSQLYGTALFQSIHAPIVRKDQSLVMLVRLGECAVNGEERLPVATRLGQPDRIAKVHVCFEREVDRGDVEDGNVGSRDRGFNGGREGGIAAVVERERIRFDEVAIRFDLTVVCRDGLNAAGREKKRGAIENNARFLQKDVRLILGIGELQERPHDAFRLGGAGDDQGMLIRCDEELGEEQREAEPRLPRTRGVRAPVASI